MSYQSFPYSSNDSSACEGEREGQGELGEWNGWASEVNVVKNCRRWDVQIETGPWVARRTSSTAREVANSTTGNSPPRMMGTFATLGASDMRW